MDFTETNIKMLEKAVEIQDGWKPAWGDLWYRPPHAKDPEHGVIGLCVEMKVNYFFPKTIWLPRQGQLQAMMGTTDLLHLVWRFNDFCHDISYPQSGYKEYPKSMEQLWLAFVMKELYSKRWTGEDWVAI